MKDITVAMRQPVFALDHPDKVRPRRCTDTQTPKKSRWAEKAVKIYN